MANLGRHRWREPELAPRGNRGRRSGRRGTEAIDAREKRERHFVRPAPLHSRVQHLPRSLDLSALERRDAVVEQLLGFALPLGQRAPGALDVGARPRVLAIQEQRARPDVDRLGVVERKILIEAAEKQALDLGSAFRVAIDRGRVLVCSGVCAARIGQIRDKSRPPGFVQRLWGKTTCDTRGQCR